MLVYVCLWFLLGVRIIDFIDWVYIFPKVYKINKTIS